MKRLFEWLHARTGYRGALEVMLDEPLPPGTSWFFTLGSVLLALLAVQFLTGAVLTLFYAPTPDHAYDSITFITDNPAGRIVRGLHHYGASFVVVAAVLHLLRVIAFGSYKRPREVTWLTGLALLGLIFAFALSGYLLPWDQRAYWATVVTINIAKLTPLAGETIAAVMRGGPSIGALTLTRWFGAHVIFLPAALALLVVVHLVLMRRHGISGPTVPRGGASLAFYPYQAARDATMALVAIGLLAAFVWHGMPPLEGRADPADSSYVPRPEWYFLGLFQLLKYFPGPWEVVGAMIVPGLAGAFLVLLPWIDRGSERRPAARRLVLTAIALGFTCIVGLTALGWHDSPASAASAWTLREIGGRSVVARANCARCHSESGIADPFERLASSRGPEWLTGHVVDPEMIAPGLREPPAPLGERDISAIVAYVHRISGQPYPGFDARTERAAAVFARYCVGCHTIAGDGAKDGPELTHEGTKHDAAWLRRWITDPAAVDPDANMPAFGKRLSPEELDAIAEHLASRK